MRSILILSLCVLALHATKDPSKNPTFPCWTQNTMVIDSEIHGKAQNSTPPYELTVVGRDGKETDTYYPGRTYTVRLVGYVHFRGLLLQPRLATSRGHIIGSLRGGEFLYSQTFRKFGIDMQQCSEWNENDSVVNVNDDKKFLIEVPWTTRKDIGAVQFMMTIVSENDLWWSRWRPRSGLIRPPSQKRDPVDEDLFIKPIGEPNAEELLKDAKFELNSSKGSTTTTTAMPFAASAFDPFDNDVTHINEDPFKIPLAANFDAAKEEQALVSMTSKLLTRKARSVLSNSLDHEDSDPCEPNPCDNGSECFVVDGEQKCKCHKGWMGPRCRDYDMCINHNCQNNATCIPGPRATFKCQCEKGTVGTFCHIKCRADQCDNGGDCEMKSNGIVGCKCAPGYYGPKCQYEVNECRYNKCKNGAECQDLINDYKCHCTAGWMGKDCNRACQDVYGSCRVWKREGQCDHMRDQTDYFDQNCAASCGICKFVKGNVKTTQPIPPILGPFSWLIGVWHSHVKGWRNHTVDYPFDFEETMGYNETISVSVASPPMFGTPSLNFTSIATSLTNSSNVHTHHGFLTIRQYSPDGGPDEKSALMTVSNLGVTMIEEGELLQSIATAHEHSLVLVPKYTVIHTNSTLPEKMSRSFVRKGSYMTQHLSRTIKGRETKFTKIYSRIETFDF